MHAELALPGNDRKVYLFFFAPWQLYVKII